MVELCNAVARRRVGLSRSFIRSRRLSGFRELQIVRDIQSRARQYSARARRARPRLLSPWSTRPPRPARCPRAACRRRPSPCRRHCSEGESERGVRAERQHGVRRGNETRGEGERERKRAHLSTLPLTRSMLGTGIVPSAALPFHSAFSALRLPSLSVSWLPVSAPQALRGRVRQSASPRRAEQGRGEGERDARLDLALDALGGRLALLRLLRRVHLVLPLLGELGTLRRPALGRARDRTDGL